MAGRWLLKTEPVEWSWEHQQANGGISNWDGVRNAQAQKHLRAMELGDLCLFYHSGAKAKEIVGIARVCKTFYPDPSDALGKHGMVDIEAVSKLSQPLPLSRLKHEDGLLNFIMFRQPRLSVVPVSAVEWNLICELAGQLEPPLLNGEFRVVVNDQALELDNDEVMAIDHTFATCTIDPRTSLPHHNADVRVRASDQIVQCDNETRDLISDRSSMPSQSSPVVRRKPRKRKTLTDAIKVKVSGSITPLEASQPPSIQRIVESKLVTLRNSCRTDLEEVLSAVDELEDDVTCAPSDSIIMKAIKFVPESKRVYSRRSRKQGEVGPLPINEEVNESTDMACANAGRVYRRRNR